MVGAQRADEAWGERIDRAVSAVRAGELRLVRVFYADYNGLLRGRVVHAAGLADRFYEGVAVPLAELVADGHDRSPGDPPPGFCTTEEVRLVADPTSLVTLPYAPRTGAMLGDLLTLGREEWDGCPRSFLRRVLADAERDGLLVEAVFDPQFYLLEAGNVAGRWHPVERTPAASAAGMQAAAAFTLDLVDGLEQQGVEIEQTAPGAGPGQHGLTVRHGPALQAADRHLWLRETVRATAARHGLRATFAARPLADERPSASHVHLSLWDTRTGENRFYDPADPGGLSASGRRFAAGVRAHLPALMAILRPTVNAYRPGAADGIDPGVEGPEDAVTVPPPMWGREQGTTNVEVRAVDGTCNPYLALGAILAAGLDGLRGGADAGPVAPPPASPSAPPPPSLGDALDALAADEVLVRALGTPLAGVFERVRRTELAATPASPGPEEYDDHIRRY